MECLILCSEEAGFHRAGNHWLKGEIKINGRGAMPTLHLWPPACFASSGFEPHGGHSCPPALYNISTMRGGLVRALLYRHGVKIA